MEPYQIYNDLNVFGFAIKTFPDGISEAFDSIVKMIPGGFSRSFYGICSMENGKLVYKATAEEIKPGEAEKYNYQRYQIEKGDYLTISITGWRKKIDQINKVFHQLMEDSRVDKTKPCVEWYKNDEELVCMIKMI